MMWTCHDLQNQMQRSINNSYIFSPLLSYASNNQLLKASASKMVILFRAKVPGQPQEQVCHLKCQHASCPQQYRRGCPQQGVGDICPLQASICHNKMNNRPQFKTSQMIDKDIDAPAAQSFQDDAFDGWPTTAAQPYSDSWHVYALSSSVLSHLQQARLERIVVDVSLSFRVVVLLDTVLGNHVDNFEVGLHLDNLNLPQEVCLELLELFLRPPPSLGEGKDKAFPPVAGVVADMDDDLLVASHWLGSVALEIADYSFCYLHTSNIIY